MFHTIDHVVLLQWLHHTFGFGGSALSRIRSYRHQRPSFIRNGMVQSSRDVGDTGVPQGLSLGPLLLLFLVPLGDIISWFSILYLQYADNTQLYIVVDHETAGRASTNLATCTTAVYEWLFHNCLALNPDMSESAVFGTVARIKLLGNIVSVNVAEMLISLSHCVKRFGVIFNENLVWYSCQCGL